MPVDFTFNRFVMRLSLALSMVLALGLAACSSINKENFHPYEGLLPAGVTPAPAPALQLPVAWKSKSVVIVATSSFEAHVKGYRDYYEGGTGERYKHFLVAMDTALTFVPPVRAVSDGLGAGNPEGIYAANRKAQDPRVVADAVTSALKKRFGKVGVAGDFAEAQDMKADFIALVDYWWAPNMMGTAFTGSTSVHLLNADLERLFIVESRTTVPRPGVTAAPTFEKIHATLTQEISERLLARLPEGR